MKESCFSAVEPVRGWNQCVKWLAPRSVAHSFMASATASATLGSSGSPPSSVRINALKICFGRRERISAIEKVFFPKIPSMSMGPRAAPPPFRLSSASHPVAAARASKRAAVLGMRLFPLLGWLGPATASGRSPLPLPPGAGGRAWRFP
jgi:hypothetical protein